MVNSLAQSSQWVLWYTKIITHQSWTFQHSKVFCLSHSDRWVKDEESPFDMGSSFPRKRADESMCGCAQSTVVKTRRTSNVITCDENMVLFLTSSQDWKVVIGGQRLFWGKKFARPNWLKKLNWLLLLIVVGWCISIWFRQQNPRQPWMVYRHTWLT